MNSLEEYKRNVLSHINSIRDIRTGKIPGWIFPKLMELYMLKIEPFDEDCLGNICYYLHFNNLFRTPKKDLKNPVNLLDEESINSAFEEYKEFDKYRLNPGESVIAQTYEKIGISPWFLSKLENATELGRCLINHASHGYLHPGHGIQDPFHLMLELTNLSKNPIIITPAQKVRNKVVGPEAMRMYLEKLPYPASEYKKITKVPKVKMNKEDGS